jgi:hypothetical protein
MSAHDQWSLAYAGMSAGREDVKFVIAHDLMLPVDTLLLSSSRTTAVMFFSHCFRFRLLLLSSTACNFFVQYFWILASFPAFPAFA